MMDGFTDTQMTLMAIGFLAWALGVFIVSRFLSGERTAIIAGLSLVALQTAALLI